jgi:hypothetical protein
MSAEARNFYQLEVAQISRMEPANEGERTTPPQDEEIGIGDIEGDQTGESIPASVRASMLASWAELENC